MSELSLKTTHIGSFPFTEVEKALSLSFKVDIPAWPQLSKYQEEGMLVQFNEGFPGYNWKKNIVETASPEFENHMVDLYEKYFAIVEEGNTDLLSSFLPSSKHAKGLHAFIEKLKNQNILSAVKGQITGPFTMGISLKNEKGENLIFKDELRDLIVKFLTLKALSQGLEFKKFSSTVIIFMDEPGLAGFGSSSYITISKEMVLSMLNEIALVLKKFNIIPGIHVCANTSWDIVLDSEIDILNFDSFNYYDKFVIYKENIKNFLKKQGKYIAWGVIPTTKEELEKVTDKEVIEKFKAQLKEMEQATGFSSEEILKKSMFTPACGLGSISEELAKKGINLLVNFKEKIQ
jgi:methionine synthase II (cobalamin-independent)